MKHVVFFITGAVMLLFEGIFGSVLHTGDCRLTRDCLNQLPAKYVMNAAHKGRTNTLDCLYLDCTFGKEVMAMPSRQDAIQQVHFCPHAFCFQSNLDVLSLPI